MKLNKANLRADLKIRPQAVRKEQVNVMTLLDANAGEEYLVKGISTDDEELDGFLFSLGCYSGEPITVISHRKGGCVVSIKDARYNIDKELAKAISI